MSFSSGTFSLYSPGNPVVTGTTIASTWANNTLSDIATGLSTCVLKDGSQTITGNIPMAGFKFTGLGAGSATGNSLRYEQVFTSGLVTLLGTLTLPTTVGVGAATPAASGAGVSFPATQSASTDANTLDDYEEGSWTPIDSSGASLSFTAGTEGSYTKVGDRVFYSAIVIYPVTVNGSNTAIGGLPYSVGSSNKNRGCSAVWGTSVVGLPNASTTTLGLFAGASGVATTNAGASGVTFIFGSHYGV
jgi:hypothetical protein